MDWTVSQSHKYTQSQRLQNFQITFQYKKKQILLNENRYQDMRSALNFQERTFKHPERS